MTIHTETEMELVLKETIVSFVYQMAVGDYCHLGDSVITRTPEGFDIEDNGEGVSVSTARRAVEIAIENAAASIDA